MRKKLILLGSFLVLVLGGCASSSYFGVPNKAIGVPGEFGQTEAAIASAENSRGAKYRPEKIARAKELAKQGAETYWACRSAEGLDLLAQARQLAKEAESCAPQCEISGEVFKGLSGGKGEPERVMEIVHCATSFLYSSDPYGPYTCNVSGGKLRL
jgi:hypothetical protein